MADTTKTPPKLSLPALRDIITDSDELGKGARLYDDKGLAHLSRYELRLYADAKGSGAAPYKVQVTFDEKVKGRCSCMAARSRPFCKHAAALLVAWARTPEAFVVSEVAPAGAAGTGTAKKKSVKASETDVKAVMGGGVEQAGTLVKELALSGIASVGADRAEQISSLGAALRESRLRRLSARVLSLSELVAEASSGADTFDATAFAELFADVVLTVRKLEKHLAGEALEPVYVEELIGKTWTKKDRAPIGDLELVEYAYSTRTTPDEFVIRESRFVDLKSGKHFAEKQIVPGFLAKRTDPKKSHAGWVLFGASGSQYPSFEPMRVDLDTPGDLVAVDGKTVEALLEKALPSVTAALTAFQDRRKDVFAPDTLPVSMRVTSLLAEGQRLQAVDEAGGALFLPDDPVLREHLAASLRGVHLEGLVGDITLDGALPTLFPLAALVRAPEGRRLVTVTTRGVSDVISSRKVRATSGTRALKGAQRPSWADVARSAGVSSAAIALGEVREELAHALVNGLASVTPRLTDPLVSRLKELGLAKQGDLLAAAAVKSDPADRLDDVVKLYQVLGIALTRLSGATHVERAGLVTVPTFESVQVARSEEQLEPRVIAERVSAGQLNRYQAAVRYAAWYDAMPVETLSKSLYPTWADGSAQPYVARVFSSRGALAVEAARQALGLLDKTMQPRWRRPAARMIRLTAVRVLEAVGTEDAARLLTQFSTQVGDAALKALTMRALRAVRARLGKGTAGLTPAELESLANLKQSLLEASRKESRVGAAHTLAEQGFLEAIPYLRASFLGDVSSDVREAAAHALGQLGDTESLDTFVAMLKGRAEDHQGAKLGAYALAHLGDIRGIDALLDAWVEGWLPAVVSESMRHVGMAAFEPLLERIERQPELVKRKAALNVVESLQPHDVAEALIARATAQKDAADFTAKALLWATLAGFHKQSADAFGKAVLELKPDLAKGGKDEKALLKKLRTVN